MHRKLDLAGRQKKNPSTSRWLLVSTGVGLLVGCNAILGNVEPEGTGGNAGTGGEDGRGGLGGEAGADDGSGGASTGGGGTGGTGGGDGSGGDGSGGDGSGGTGPEPSVIGVRGEACAPEGAFGCAGYDQQVQLECKSGKWENFGQCSSSQRCDTRLSNAGVCEPIVSACVEAEPGDATMDCSGNSPVVCGPDRVTVQDGAPCEVDTGCLDGACEQVITECAGQADGDVVCSEDASEAFVCEENLTTKGATDTCDGVTVCSAGACVPPSCAGLAAICGPDGDGDCCESPPVEGGAFNRGANFPATISGFRLDKYEVTVGRFRNYVAATVAGWLPAAGSGKHTHLNNGDGLAATGGGYEPGWDATWNVGDSTYGMYSGSDAAEPWDTSLNCTSSATWTSGADSNESLAVNCVNWYQSVAFCIWDGGFLPSEAEWEYAAAGGNDERNYPWGSPAPDCTYANFNNCVGGVERVGSHSPKGDALWEQSDLGGNVWEWVLDWYASPLSATCADCTNATAASERDFRGGSWNNQAAYVTAAYRSSVASPDARYSTNGFRCARAP